MPVEVRGQPVGVSGLYHVSSRGSLCTKPSQDPKNVILEKASTLKLLMVKVAK